VEREAHDRRLDHRAGSDRGLQVLAPEALEARRQGEVRRGRVLGLERRQRPDRLGGREPAALEQALARR